MIYRKKKIYEPIEWRMFFVVGFFSKIFLCFNKQTNFEQFKINFVVCNVFLWFVYNEYKWMNLRMNWNQLWPIGSPFNCLKKEKKNVTKWCGRSVWIQWKYRKKCHFSVHDISYIYIGVCWNDNNQKKVKEREAK